MLPQGQDLLLHPPNLPDSTFDCQPSPQSYPDMTIFGDT